MERREQKEEKQESRRADEKKSRRERKHKSRRVGEQTWTLSVLLCRVVSTAEFEREPGRPKNDPKTMIDGINVGVLAVANCLTTLGGVGEW